MTPLEKQVEEAADLINDVNAAHEFMERLGIKPTPDAIEQLLEGFVPCLRIMTDRAQNRSARMWETTGRRGLLTDCRKKFDRFWYLAWTCGRFDEENPPDLINFLAFYLRTYEQEDGWGTWGEPGVSQ